MPDLNRKVKKSKPVPMPDVSDKNYKSNMPKIEGKKKEEELRKRSRKPRKPKTGRVSEKERELMEKLKPSKPSSSLDDKMKKQLIEGIDVITGKSASRRIASGGEVKKMEKGGDVRASRKSARKSIDGCILLI